METFIASFIIIGIAISAMAIGVIVSNRSITGSCGGLNSIEGLESACDICTKPCEKKRQVLKELKEETTEKNIQFTN